MPDKVIVEPRPGLIENIGKAGFDVEIYTQPSKPKFTI